MDESGITAIAAAGEDQCPATDEFARTIAANDLHPAYTSTVLSQQRRSHAFTNNEMPFASAAARSD